MPSLKQFREMAGLPDDIRRWSDAAERVKVGQQALVDQAAGKTPLVWHPQVRRESAEADGFGPADFNFEQWPVLNVRLEKSRTRHAPFWYACDITPGTPQANQYVEDKRAKGGYRKLPDPNGICLQSIEFELYTVRGAKLDSQDSLPSEGKVQGRPSDRSELWKRLVPDTSIKVKLVAWPDFFFLNKDGGAVSYSNTGDGQFFGARVESGVYTLSMDHGGNVTVK